MQHLPETGAVRTMEGVEEMIISNTELTNEPTCKEEAKPVTMLAFHDEDSKYWVVTSNPEKVIAHIGEENLVWTKER